MVSVPGADDLLREDRAASNSWSEIGLFKRDVLISLDSV